MCLFVQLKLEEVSLIMSHSSLHICTFNSLRQVCHIDNTRAWLNMKSNRVNKKQGVKHWWIPLLKLQELPKAFGWDPVANTTTPVFWHLMQQTGKLTVWHTVAKKNKKTFWSLKYYVDLLNWNNTRPEHTWWLRISDDLQNCKRAHLFIPVWSP